MSDESRPPVPQSNGSEGAGPTGAGPDRDWWLDRPSSIALLIKLLVAACLASVAADFFFHKHGDYSFQEWLAFDAVFGFVSYVSLVTVAKGVRRLLMRSEDYYD